MENFFSSIPLPQTFYVYFALDLLREDIGLEYKDFCKASMTLNSVGSFGFQIAMKVISKVNR